MQINEIKVPANIRRVNYQIASSGLFTKLKPQPEKRQNMRSHPPTKLQTCKIELGQLNSIKLTKDIRFQDILQDNPFVCIPTPPPTSTPKRKLKCNCKKSKCLKLYCECFSNQLICGLDCECQNCANRSLSSKRLGVLREEVVVKKTQEGKGCKCTKSNCQKKYCDCFNRGVECGRNCFCENCQNGNHKPLQTSP